MKMHAAKYIPIMLLSAICFVSLVGEATAGLVPRSFDSHYPRIIYTQKQIDLVALKIQKNELPYTSAYEDLIRVADSYSNRTHTATSDFHTPPYYDDQAENAQAKEGLALDAHAAHTNALAYALSGETKYAQKAIYFLNAWASIHKTITENDVQGEATGTVLTASNLMSGFLIAADLLLGQAIWSENEKTIFKLWVQQVFLPAASSIKTKTNNWGDWGTFGTASSYHILKDQTKLLLEIERMKARIDKYQDADGFMPQEIRREANGLWYTYFALVPVTLSAQLAYNTTGEDLFHYESANGKKIQKALNCLYYYIFHKSEWPWYPMKDSAPGRDAPCDLFEAMNPYYNNQYETYTSSFRPVKGDYKGSRVSHLGWSFPTLMKTTDDLVNTDKKNIAISSQIAYYNPIQEKIIFMNEVKNLPCFLFDAYGKMVKKNNTSDQYMDISDMPTGYYFLKVAGQILKIIRIKS
ncbi:MAG: alginate lyase family protein [Paludibacter sp.]|nr:alginate lyase family protein [Paludibacter sp.]